MKKNAFIILLSISIFLSCERRKSELDLITRQLESRLEMEEKVNRIATQLRADCDSNLLQLAKIKTDSIILKRGKTKQ